MKTLIVGASPNPDRYAHRAALKLLQHGHEVVLLGLQHGEVAGHPILTGHPELADIDTVTLYVGPRNSGEYADYLKKIRPRRVIFNPGAENPDLAATLRANGIEPVEACTLVMLSVGSY